MLSITKKVKNKVRKLFKFFDKTRILELIQIMSSSSRHRKALKIVHKKSTIKIAFFVIHGSVWKYDKLYKLLEIDPRYDPYIVICPYTDYDSETMFREMKIAIKFFSEKQYSIINTYNEINKTWIDIKKTLEPDIVFFTNPHLLTKKEYYITNFLDTLTCYCQYSFHVTHLNKMQYNQFFHNVLWKAFYETQTHYNLARQYSRIKAKNVIITGFPGVDVFFDLEYKPNNQWKNIKRSLKKIIWAPHHTIDDKKKVLSFSTFLLYSDFFLELAFIYRDQIQIAFKPHPILRAKLSDEKVWGVEKTNLYYSKWVDLENGQLEECSYEDLFLTSDALILDCASFMTEYLCTRKPSLFLMNDSAINERFNIFGKIIFEHLYHAKNINEIIKFIDDVVISGKDYMKNERDKLIHENIVRNASTNIKKELDCFCIIK